mgnify:FL=1
MTTGHAGNGHDMNNGSGRMEVGMRKGIRAFFDIDGITIAFWGSAWTGREVVTVDDRVVSNKRSLRFVTEHRFEHAGIRYKLVFRAVSMLAGHMRIELYREGALVDSDEFRQKNAFVDSKTGRVSVRRAILKILPYFVLGMLVGASAAWLVEYLTGA